MHRLEQRPLLRPRSTLLDLAAGTRRASRVGRPRTTCSTASTKRALPPGVRRSLARAWTSIRWSMIGCAVADLLAPAVGLVAQHLVGVLARRAAGRRARRPAPTPESSRDELADQLLERRRAEGAGLLARGVDVVGEGDPLRVPGDQRDLLRASAPCRGWRPRSRSPPGGPSARRCSPRRSRPGRSCGSPTSPGRSGTASGSCRTAASPGELRYFGPWSRPPSPTPSLPRIAPAEPDGMPVRVADREDHPLAEPVVDAAAALARAGEADLEELARRDTGASRRAGGRACPSRAGAQPSWCFSIVSSVNPRPRR